MSATSSRELAKAESLQKIGLENVITYIQSGNVVFKTPGTEMTELEMRIKEAIKEAILEGEIPNDYNAAYKLMLKEGKRLGLKINT